MQSTSYLRVQVSFGGTFLLLIAGLDLPCPAQILIDHTCCDLSNVPVSWIDQAKSQFRVWYGHTSHGSQITSGMRVLNTPPFTYSWDASGGSLSYQETGGDLGHSGDLAWEQATRDQLENEWNDRNFVMWSWCGGVSDNTVEGIQTYLNAMAQLEEDYPGVRFIYMTGHLDGSGVEGDLNRFNNQIREFCLSHRKVLFDFADIESYDPDGNAFLALYANDNCDYFDGEESRNWAVEWCSNHPGQCSSCDCAHSQSLNCDRKGRAFWWMLARLAGWNGEEVLPTETPTPIATSSPTPTWTPTSGPTLTPTPTPTSGPEMGVLGRVVDLLHWEYARPWVWSEGTILHFEASGGWDSAAIHKYPSVEQAQAAFGEANEAFHGYPAQFHGYYATEPDYGNHYSAHGTRRWIYRYYVFQGDSDYHSTFPPYGIPDPLGVVEALYQAAVEGGLLPMEPTPTPTQTPLPTGVDLWRVY